ncbi:ead/Ea22-like family protein [Klebsiella variicola]|uniref:ead/Ea22-like family protein n=1 Tax=Klebsiella variicola TaxID=244366 RepID=UPI003B7F9111
MTTDITELAPAMKAAAMKATPGPWVAFTHTDSRTFSVHTPDDKRCGDVIKWAGFDGQRKAKANAEFIALANPANILALVEALEKTESAKRTLESLGYRDNGGELWRPPIGPKPNFSLMDSYRQRIAELESFRTAYMEWSDKTDWVNTDRRFGVVKPLGKHRADVLKAYIEHLESRTITVKLPEVYGYLRENDGQIKISIGAERPSDRSGGYATPWFAIYTAAGNKWEAD